MELYLWFILPLVVALMFFGLIIGIPAGRKIGGTWPAGIALGMLLAILPALLLFIGLFLRG